METGALDPKDIQTIVQSLYRLFRVGGFHLLDNDAVTLATEDTLRSLGSLKRFDQLGITLVFAEDTVIVNGQLLQAAPDVYESAIDFSRFLTDIEMNAISIRATVGSSDLRALLALFRERERAGEMLTDQGDLTPNIQLRRINPDLLLGLEDDRLSVLDRVLLTYALTVLVMRRLFESVSEGGFELAGYFKRLSRQLARVNYVDRPVVFDVILARYLDADDAKRAVNAAILAIAMARRATEHEITLSRVAMAALLLPVGRYRPRPTPVAVPDDAVSAAIVNMAMGELFGDNLERTIIAWEAQRLVDGATASTLYPDENQPSLEARIVRTAHRCIEEMVGSGDIDAALEALLLEAADASDRLMLALLIDAVGVLPRGTCVELEDGSRGIVLAAGRRPTTYDRPTVQVLLDARGNSCTPREVDLTDDAPANQRLGGVARVVHHPNALLRASAGSLGGALPHWLMQRTADEAATRAVFDLEDEQRGKRTTVRDAPRAAETVDAEAVQSGDFEAASTSVRSGSAFQRLRSSLRPSGAEGAVEGTEFRRSPSVRRTTGDFSRTPSVRRTTGGFSRDPSEVRDTDDFARTPSTVSRLQRTTRGDQGAASEFRRRASSARHSVVAPDPRPTAPSTPVAVEPRPTAPTMPIAPPSAALPHERMTPPPPQPAAPSAPTTMPVDSATPKKDEAIAPDLRALLEGFLDDD